LSADRRRAPGFCGIRRGNLGVTEVLGEGLAAFKVENGVTQNDNLETAIIRDVARWATISAMIASALWTRLEFITLLYV
jgi:hypothetical protein